MNPPAKRPRLGKAAQNAQNEEDEADNQDELSMTPVQFNAQQDPSYHLEKGREKAATKLKSRFESIFDKYGKDFTDVGDEIDFETGEITIDNGHIQSWEHDDDDDIANTLLASDASDDEEDPIPVITSSDQTLANPALPSAVSTEIPPPGSPPPDALLGQASSMLGQVMPSLPQGAMTLGQSGNMVGGSGFFGPHMFGPNSPFNFGFMSFGLGRGPVDPNWQVPELPMSLQNSMSPQAALQGASASSIQYDSRGRPKNRPSLTDVVRQKWPKLKPKTTLPTPSNTTSEVDPLALNEPGNGDVTQGTCGIEGTSTSQRDSHPGISPVPVISHDVDEKATDPAQSSTSCSDAAARDAEQSNEKDDSKGTSGNSEIATLQQDDVPQRKTRGRPPGGQANQNKAQESVQNEKTTSSEQKPRRVSTRLKKPQANPADEAANTKSQTAPESQVIEVSTKSESRQKKPRRSRKSTESNGTKSQPKAKEGMHNFPAQQIKPADVTADSSGSKSQRQIEVVLGEQVVDPKSQPTTLSSTNTAPEPVPELFTRHEMDPSFIFSDDDDDFRKPRQTKKSAPIKADKRSQKKTESVDTTLDVEIHEEEMVIETQPDVADEVDNEVEDTTTRTQSVERETNGISHNQAEEAPETPNDDIDAPMEDVETSVTQPEPEVKRRKLRRKTNSTKRSLSPENTETPVASPDPADSMDVVDPAIAITTTNTAETESQDDHPPVQNSGPETPEDRLSKISAQPPLTSSVSRREKKRKLAALSSLIPENEAETGGAGADLDELSIISSAGFDSTPKSFRIKLEERSFHGSSPAPGPAHHQNKANAAAAITTPRHNHHIKRGKENATPRKTPSPFVPPHLRHIYQYHHNEPPTPSPRRNNASSSSLSRRTQHPLPHPPATDFKALPPRKNSSNTPSSRSRAAQSSPLARTAAWRRGNNTMGVVVEGSSSSFSSSTPSKKKTTKTRQSSTVPGIGEGGEEEGEGTIVQTPGGTRRRCGVDGFVCDRDFCLTCCT